MGYVVNVAVAIGGAGFVQVTSVADCCLQLDGGTSPVAIEL